MGQFDNFKSIAMLFTGAFLVSFGVIAFLNIEVQSRSNHGFTFNNRTVIPGGKTVTFDVIFEWGNSDSGVKIRNENLFEVLGRKISQIISSLRERNSYRRSILYQIFTQENKTRTPLRKLQYYNEEEAVSVDNVAEQYYNQTHRHLRHAKKIKRLTEFLLRGKNHSRELKFELENKYKLKGEGFISVLNNRSNNRTIMPNAYNTTKKDALDEELRVHENCYTTNDVLEIIALTCLVNFSFWFLIIFCVNILTRNQKMWKFDSFESLASAGSGSEYELSQGCSKKAIDKQNLLTDYVNPFRSEPERENPESEDQEPSTWSHFRPKVGSEKSQEKINTEKWIHQRFIHLSNIFFDTVSLDNLKPVKKKNFVSRNKKNKIVNSFSMEDLIF